MCDCDEGTVGEIAVDGTSEREEGGLRIMNNAREKVRKSRIRMMMRVMELFFRIHML